MKQILLNTFTSFLFIVKISRVLDMFPTYHILFKNGIFFGISREVRTDPPNDTPVFWQFLNRNISKSSEIRRGHSTHITKF